MKIFLRAVFFQIIKEAMMRILYIYIYKTRHRFYSTIRSIERKHDNIV